ncbi:protein regulator of cytokinesis 1-like [Chironomus tepperi]|uniref:protein regulator of cytokinesis 1-like n=1 Tax=Chironomus tepperi TaxID=113505 RepID=UPI00391EE699
MDDLRQKVTQEVSEIAEEKIEYLSQLWKELFEKEIGMEHMKKLLNHVDAFFTDIIVETESRKEAIMERIEDLNREKENLKRLLKEDVEDVPESHVPLYTLQMNIDESLKNLREKLNRRHEQIKNFLREQDALCSELGEPKRPLSSDPLPSEAEMNQFSEHLESLSDLKFKRLEEIMNLREDIKDVINKLELKVLGEFENNLINSDDLKPLKNNIQKLKDLYELFESQFQKMKYQMEDMRKRLGQLWKFLDVPESHQHKFDKYTEITQTNYDKLHFEVERCEKIKRENIRVFIERVRIEIEEYWDKCLKSDAERLRFRTFTANTYNEDVLELHEDELRELKLFYENNEPIFKMIQERQDLWNQMELLQNKEQDPKRYANRGGQLLKEEKERKMISIKLPKIEAKLIEMCQDFEKTSRRPFTVFGVAVQDLIEKDYDTKRQEKLTKSGKKILATPAKTPLRANTTGLRTPLTVEQTIINRTNAAKTTGNRLKPPTSALQIKTLSTTNSSTASSVRSVRTENGKRKVPVQVTSAPPAKRKLLGAFASPAPRNVLKPSVNNTQNVQNNASRSNKSATLKVYNVGSVIKRRSRSRKSVGKKRRSSIQKCRKIPEIVLSSTETLNTDTTSYEGFENYAFVSKSVLRSSELPRPHYVPVNHHGFASPILRKTPTNQKRLLTPSNSTPAKNVHIQPKELEFSMII